MRVRWKPTATEDMRDIWRYIADDDVGAADQWFGRLVDKVDRLPENPEIGRSRDEVQSGIRSVPLGNYVIFYRVTVQGVELLRIIHAARDLRRIALD